MTVSPCETKVVWHSWRGLVCASLFFVPLFGAVAQAQEPRFFRIGTAATGGSFFEIGGLVASAISGPADGPPCGRGGSCGVRGLVAVAQATPGTIENLRLINSGQLESGIGEYLGVGPARSRFFPASGDPVLCPERRLPPVQRGG